MWFFLWMCSLHSQVSVHMTIAQSGQWVSNTTGWSQQRARVGVCILIRVSHFLYNPKKYFQLDLNMTKIITKVQNVQKVPNSSLNSS